MKLDLSENIRKYRKARKLTQEQLAEALGVTTGAVHKWEAGLSVPELEMLIKTADLFDTSVDSLLGYRIKDDRREAAMERLSGYCRRMDPEAIPEAERLLTKYPNSFEVVRGCAAVYIIFGAGGINKTYTRKGLELLEKSLVLLPQNTDPRISEHLIYKAMAAAYYSLGELEKALVLMKDHNVGGLFSSEIGLLLTLLKRPAEAAEFLDESLFDNVIGLLSTVYAYVLRFSAEGNYASAESIASWGLELLDGLKDKDKEGLDFLDKSRVELMTLLAHTALRTKGRDQAVELLRKAEELAERFDAAPDYGFGTIKYASEIAGDANVHDVTSSTAMDAIESVLRDTGDTELAALRKGATE